MKPIIIRNEPLSDAILERGSIIKADRYFELDRRVLVLTDRDVPSEYVDVICARCLYPVRVSVWPGDDVNSLDNYSRLCKAMLDNRFETGDCIVAVGGERVMELGGFLAATYKGGIEYCCVPTTLKAQTGSGILGVSYLSLDAYKNALGADSIPKRTLVDPEALDTLDEKRIANGYAEMIRLGLTLDSKLFEMLEREDMSSERSFDKALNRSIEIRRYIYRNEKENRALRTIVNMGSLIADSMEKTKFSYGERLAIGMLPFCGPEVRARLRDLFTKFGLPVVWQYDAEKLFRDSIRNYESDRVTVARCDEVGASKADSLTVPEYHKLINAVYGG